ncbi:hypothetical protein [Acinetobacter stercoris]|uniref:Uncharacterized protein n=1 Tax=Acinetobacter stercoris TaxID=2126983 RepID=A0A2U3N3L1_9GAMM|nr:hypothetical protein [Acinetobacter stercoris]SPL72261.1 hypothetical protein KPC_3439 [Acinetobacter stercoris]
MKALLLSDEINHFHWAMLKSVLLVLSLLPASHFFLNLLQNTQGGSQIVIGFFAVSLFSALTILAFYSALNATIFKMKHTQASTFEEQVIKIYRYIPMLSLASMISYLVVQL